MTAIQRYIYADTAALNKDIQKIKVSLRKLKTTITPMQVKPVWITETSDEIPAYAVIETLESYVSKMHELLDDLMIAFQNENPASSFKIDQPVKTSKKEKWWVVKLLDASGLTLKEHIIPFRTKTEIKLYVKSTIGKIYLSRAIHSAVVEGPYKTMMEASKHKSLP